MYYEGVEVRWGFFWNIIFVLFGKIVYIIDNVGFFVGGSYGWRIIGVGNRLCLI